MTEFNRDDVADTMSSFEAAVSAPRLEIPAIEVKRILLALDGSNQDPAAVELAAAVATSAAAGNIHLSRAYEGAADARHDDYLAEQARSIAGRTANVTIDHSPADTTTGRRPFQQILEVAAKQQCDLIITIAPYLDDYAQLGTASTGTNLDMLLHHRRAPLLVVREPYPDIVRCLGHLIVPLHFAEASGTDALAWALKLVGQDSGTIHLLAIADTEAIQTAAPLAGRGLDPQLIDERELAGLVRSTTAGLIAAAQRRAAADNIACRVSIRIGQPMEQLLAFAREQHRSLIVTGCPDNCSTTGYLRVQALIRQSPNPVLVV